MGKYLDIARKLENQKNESPGSHVEILEPATFQPVKSDGRLDFIDHLTEAEREAYLCLVEIAQTPRFGSDRKTAEEIAGSIVTKKYSPFQLGQAAKDYKKYAYVKIYSGVLGKAVYFAKDEKAAKRVPNKGLPVFLESDTEAIKDLASEEIKLLLEAKILFGGSITKETN